MLEIIAGSDFGLSGFVVNNAGGMVACFLSKEDAQLFIAAKTRQAEAEERVRLVREAMKRTRFLAPGTPECAEAMQNAFQRMYNRDGLRMVKECGVATQGDWPIKEESGATGVWPCGCPVESQGQVWLGEGSPYVELKCPTPSLMPRGPLVDAVALAEATSKLYEKLIALPEPDVGGLHRFVMADGMCMCGHTRETAGSLSCPFWANADLPEPDAIVEKP